MLTKVLWLPVLDKLLIKFVSVDEESLLISNTISTKIILGKGLVIL